MSPRTKITVTVLDNESLQLAAADWDQPGWPQCSPYLTPDQPRAAPTARKTSRAFGGLLPAPTVTAKSTSIQRSGWQGPASIYLGFY